MDKNKYSSDMEQEIENILLNSSLTDGEVSRLTNELLNLFSVSDSFEVGIEVKITKRIHGHEFEIGDVVEIVEKEIDGDDVLWWCSNGVHKWCIDEDEAERLSTRTEEI